MQDIEYMHTSSSPNISPLYSHVRIANAASIHLLSMFWVLPEIIQNLANHWIRQYHLNLWVSHAMCCSLRIGLSSTLHTTSKKHSNLIRPDTPHSQNESCRTSDASRMLGTFMFGYLDVIKNVPTPSFQVSPCLLSANYEEPEPCIPMN